MDIEIRTVEKEDYHEVGNMIPIEHYKNMKAIHIIKDNQLIYEMKREIDKDRTLYPVGCIFKSFLSVLTGIAIYKGKIQSLDDCVIDYFPHDEITDIGWYKLRISHALSKRTGIRWPGPGKALPSSDEVMQLHFESEPGTEFKYKPDPMIIVYLLEEVYGMNINDILEKELLAYFNHTEYQWSGQSDNMLVSIELLDEFGQFMRHKGIIDGTRLLSEEYYQNSIRKHSEGGFPECSPYGLGWWIGEHENIPYFYSAGFGGQILGIIPQKNIVVSILSDMDRPHPENKKIIELLIES